LTSQSTEVTDGGQQLLQQRQAAAVATLVLERGDEQHVDSQSSLPVIEMVPVSQAAQEVGLAAVSLSLDMGDAPGAPQTLRAGIGSGGEWLLPGNALELEPASSSQHIQGDSVPVPSHQGLLPPRIATLLQQVSCTHWPGQLQAFIAGYSFWVRVQQGIVN
jgi:hypothetical protein